MFGFFLGFSPVSEICALLHFQDLGFVSRAGWLVPAEVGEHTLPFLGAPPEGGKSSRDSCQGTEGELPSQSDSRHSDDKEIYPALPSLPAFCPHSPNGISAGGNPGQGYG